MRWTSFRRHFGEFFGEFFKKYGKVLTKRIESGTLATSPKKENNMATDKKRVQVSFTDEQHQMLVDLAKSKGFSKSAIIVLALEEYLKMQK
mgnify:FL=1